MDSTVGNQIDSFHGFRCLLASYIGLRKQNRELHKHERKCSEARKTQAKLSRDCQKTSKSNHSSLCNGIKGVHYFEIELRAKKWIRRWSFQRVSTHLKDGSQIGSFPQGSGWKQSIFQTTHWGNRSGCFSGYPKIVVPPNDQRLDIPLTMINPQP